MITMNSTVAITWVPSNTLAGNKCDFCSDPLPAGQVAVIHVHAVGNRGAYCPGPFAPCLPCQEKMVVKPGDDAVDLELVRRRHREEAAKFVERKRVPHLRPPFWSDMLPGDGRGGKGQY